MNHVDSWALSRELSRGEANKIYFNKVQAVAGISNPWPNVVVAAPLCVVVPVPQSTEACE